MFLIYTCLFIYNFFPFAALIEHFGILFSSLLSYHVDYTSLKTCFVVDLEFTIYILS